MEWRTLSWLPGYEVSECGQVRRTQKVGSHPAGRLCKGFVNSKGYRRYNLTVANRIVRVTASRIVCEAWHGTPPQPDMQAAHRDGNSANNHYSNLRWATAAENCADKIAHGTYHSGERNPHALLTNEQALEMRAAYRRRLKSTRELADAFNVSVKVARNVAHGRTYASAGGVR